VKHWLLFYDYVLDHLERRTPFRPQHLRLAQEARDRGELVLAGAYGDGEPGSLFVWRVDDPATIERFVEGDPYVKNGVVTHWRIRPWNVVIGG